MLIKQCWLDISGKIERFLLLWDSVLSLFDLAHFILHLLVTAACIEGSVTLTALLFLSKFWYFLSNELKHSLYYLFLCYLVTSKQSPSQHGQAHVWNVLCTKIIPFKASQADLDKPNMWIAVSVSQVFMTSWILDTILLFFEFL